METIARAFAEEGFELRSVVRGRSKGSDVEHLLGEVPPQEPVVIDEHGVKYEVDFCNGHKTGFFLDQRDHRRMLRDLAAGKDVLDLFTYTGGFAVAAAVGGARSTTCVDRATPAIKAAKRNFALNGFQADPEVWDFNNTRAKTRRGEAHAVHRLVNGDCWSFLAGSATLGETYDVVVNDPPSFAPSQKAKQNAMLAYEQLNALVLKVIRPGGLLLTCSCSSHIKGQDFRQAVFKAAASAGVRVRLEAEGRAAVDHPVRNGFPEGDYLQALYIRVLT